MTQSLVKDKQTNKPKNKQTNKQKIKTTSECSGPLERLAVTAPYSGTVMLLLSKIHSISQECGKGGIVNTSEGKYPWSLWTQIFRNC